MDFVLIGVGLVLLLAGGDLLVRGSVAVARRLRLPPFFVGVVLVGFGTSAPEMATSLLAVFAGAPAIAVGNVVGSNIANILLILGVTAMLATVPCDARALRQDGLVLLLVTGAVVGLASTAALTAWHGAALLALLVAYLVLAFRWGRAAEGASSADGEGLVVSSSPSSSPSSPSSLSSSSPPPLSSSPSPSSPLSPAAHPALGVGLAVMGCLLAVGGAHLLVDGAISLAASLGVSQATIGLTLGAVGTSLPELVASIIAVLRREADVALGGVIGSNIYNLCAVLGVTSLVQTLQIPPEIVRLDLWVMLAVTVLLLVFARTGGGLSRGEGAVMVGGYGVYVGAMAV